MLQRTKRQMEEWVNPTAMTVVAAYLCLEAQITHELAYVAVTHFAAITVLDLISRPWAHPAVMVRCLPPTSNWLSLAHGQRNAWGCKRSTCWMLDTLVYTVGMPASPAGALIAISLTCR